MSENVVEKMNRVPIGYIVSRCVSLLLGDRYLVRNWKRNLSFRWSPYVGDAKLWKTATQAFRVADGLRGFYTHGELHVQAVYEDPRRAGMRSLVA